MNETESPNILRFDPPAPLYRIEVNEEEGTETIIQEPLGELELKSRMRVAIPNPWSQEELRFLPGVAVGDGREFVMSVGQSFGSLVFIEGFGWACQALVPHAPVMQGMAEDLAKKSQKFTDRLLKKK